MIPVGRALGPRAAAGAFPLPQIPPDRFQKGCRKHPPHTRTHTPPKPTPSPSCGFFHTTELADLASADGNGPRRVCARACVSLPLQTPSCVCVCVLLPLQTPSRGGFIQRLETPTDSKVPGCQWVLGIHLNGKELPPRGSSTARCSYMPRDVPLQEKWGWGMRGRAGLRRLKRCRRGGLARHR